jgi:hypothetical protein
MTKKFIILAKKESFVSHLVGKIYFMNKYFYLSNF